MLEKLASVSKAQKQSTASHVIDYPTDRRSRDIYLERLEHHEGECADRTSSNQLMPHCACKPDLAILQGFAFVETENQGNCLLSSTMLFMRDGCMKIVGKIKVPQVLVAK